MFAVDVRRDGHVLVFALRGELDFHSVVQLHEAGEQELTTGGESSPLVVDCTHLTYCDSTGISALVLLNQQQAAQGHTLRLSSVPDFLGRLFTLTGLDQIMSLHGTVADAVAAAARDRGTGPAGDDRPVQPNGGLGR